VQIGGGIRNMNIANTYIEAGISYLIIGTMAVTHPEFVSELCREFPGKIIVGLDANNGLVATEGWARQTDLHVVELSKKFEQDGVSSIVYTDIARDASMLRLLLIWLSKLQLILLPLAALPIWMILLIY
jgi:phosphoribosylformimino-5-aminoimidazole carboxamide ribotide isomerase